jgi:hypothetical protein
MKTKYGDMPNELLVAYVDGLIGKVWKILPMKDSKSNTIEKYLNGLLRELVGNKELVFELRDNQDFLSILGSLESLIDEEEHSIYRSDVFKTIGLINRIKDSLIGDAK